MVDVCMITYNHESFIAQAIEGFLIQKTNFQTRLIIGEDCSKDNTRAICIEYQSKYPERIILLPDEGNLGMNPNFLRTLKACTAKYVALCEGDDYWTDPLKLQKQVDFMNLNSDFAICFHKMQVIYEEDSSKNYVTNEQPEFSTLEDLAKQNYIYTASCIFRNKLFLEFPNSFNKSPVGDYFLHILNAQYGKIKFINEIMGVYRVHIGGIWENKSEIYRLIKWLDVQNFLIPELTGTSKNVMIMSLQSNLNLISNLYYSKTKEQDEVFGRWANPVLIRYLELWSELKFCRETMMENKNSIIVLKEQIKNDFKSPIRTFFRNIYYKFSKKTIKCLE